MFNEHLNLRPYRTAQHVKFHIQNDKDVPGVALCGGIYLPQRYCVFSSAFVLRFDSLNRCSCCVVEYERQLNRQTENA